MKTILELISDVRKHANIPDGQITDSDMLNIVEHALSQEVYPEIFSYNEEFFLVRETVTLPSNSTLPVMIPFPRRAYGRNLREVKWLNQSNGSRINIPLINLDDQDQYSYVTTPGYSLNGFFVMGDTINLLGKTEGVLELTYAVSLPTLSTSTTLKGDVASLAFTDSTNTCTFTVGSVGTDLNTYCPTGESDYFDIFRKSSGSYIHLDILLTRSGNNFSTTSITKDRYNFLNMLSRAGQTDLVLLPADINVYAPIPAEAETYLIMASKAEYFETYGDTEALQVTNMSIDEQRKYLAKALAKRITGEAKIITNRRGIRAYSYRYWARR